MINKDLWRVVREKVIICHWLELMIWKGVVILAQDMLFASAM
jgi:hypothetical protein